VCGESIVICWNLYSCGTDRHPNTDGMQCGHDCCRLWWSSRGGYSWYGTEQYSPVTCVLSSTPAIPLPSFWYPPNYVPLQPAVVYLKKLNPERARITHEHVLTSLGDEGRGLSRAETMAKIEVFRNEAKEVIKWGGEQVKKRMLKAAARVGLQVDGRVVDNFQDLKNSWKADGRPANAGKIYAICYGDYEGSENQQWSRALEIEYMTEKNMTYDSEPSLRDKGGYELCITNSKGTIVRQIMAGSKDTHGGVIVLSLKNRKDLQLASKEEKGTASKRRKEGEFFFKKNVSNAVEKVGTVLRRTQKGALLTTLLVIVVLCMS